MVLGPSKGIIASVLAIPSSLRDLLVSHLALPPRAASWSIVLLGAMALGAVLTAAAGATAIALVAGFVGVLVVGFALAGLAFAGVLLCVVLCCGITASFCVAAAVVACAATFEFWRAVYVAGREVGRCVITGPM
jgi:hypothetical protein